MSIKIYIEFSWLVIHELCEFLHWVLLLPPWHLKSTIVFLEICTHPKKMNDGFAVKPWEHEDIFNPNPTGAETGEYHQRQVNSREISKIQVQWEILSQNNNVEILHRYFYTHTFNTHVHALRMFESPKIVSNCFISWPRTYWNIDYLVISFWEIW